MNKHTLFLSGALLLALLSAGCIGGKGDAGAAKAKDKKNKTEIASEDQSLADARYDSLTPENSMRRDLELLRERERNQTQTLSEMRGVLNENESTLKREENRLAEMRAQIMRYEEALGQRPPGATQNGFARQAEFARADTGSGFSEYDHLFQRQANANVARDATQARQPQAIRQPYQQPSVTMAAAPGGEPGQSFIREPQHFAGAPRGRARTDFSTGQPRRNEGEIVVWNPNDPNQAVPPEVSLGLEYAPPETHAQLPTVATGPAPSPYRHGDNTADASPFGKYATETFSPDLYLGKGG